LGSYGNSYDDNLYAYYDKCRGKAKAELYDPVTRSSYTRVLNLLSSHGDGRTILDVGCGKGDFVDAAIEQGYLCEGIDLAEPAVDIARGFGLPVYRRDFYSEEIKEGSWDMVTLFEVIEHLPDPLGFVKRAESVVKPGGLIYITTPNFNSLDRRVLGSDWNAIHREHLIYFTPSSLLDAIRRHTNLELVFAETRNVSEELANKVLQRFRLRKQLNEAGGRAEFQQVNLRREIERSKLLYLLKRMSNAFLDFASLGSTIVMLLKRPTP
jgi:2-polyprenyl-3-methyl-5-hydroxy-6-metoxy-1,4-benzoquinol methylase